MGYFEDQEKLKPKQVMYVGAKKDDDYKDQIQWGNNTDPRPLLVVGRQYEVDREEVHSWHTKVFLLGFEDKPFNSIWFVDVT